MFQWTSSECLTNVTITIKVAMVTYIHCEDSSLNFTLEAYLETYKHLRQGFLREQFTAEAVTSFHKKKSISEVNRFQLRVCTSSVEQF